QAYPGRRGNGIHLVADCEGSLCAFLIAIPDRGARVPDIGLEDTLPHSTIRVQTLAVLEKQATVRNVGKSRRFCTCLSPLGPIRTCQRVSCGCRTTPSLRLFDQFRL